MEIPYTVHPREDTGLYNAKVGVWLFLASEVMLFGALFSSYILLRVGAAPGTWPHGLLNVPIGTLNTLVLITSSITVVLAWASLKLHNFGRFRLFQACTVLLACTFVVIKSFEYRDKFTHYEVILNDGSVVDGHLVSRTADQVVIHPAEKAHGKGAEAAGPSTQVEKNGHGHEVTVPLSQIKKMENYGPWHNTYMAIYFTLTGLHALHVIGGALVIGYLWGPGAGMWKTDPERFTNRVEVSGLFWHFVDLVWIFLFPVLYLL
jgi:cytochrome c oxidase subunit 3